MGGLEYAKEAYQARARAMASSGDVRRMLLAAADMWAYMARRAFAEEREEKGDTLPHLRVREGHVGGGGSSGENVNEYGSEYDIMARGTRVYDTVNGEWE